MSATTQANPANFSLISGLLAMRFPCSPTSRIARRSGGGDYSTRENVPDSAGWAKRSSGENSAISSRCDETVRLYRRRGVFGMEEELTLLDYPDKPEYQACHIDSQSPTHPRAQKWASDPVTPWPSALFSPLLALATDCRNCRFCRGGVFVATAQRLGNKQLKCKFTKLIGMVSGNGVATERQRRFL